MFRITTEYIYICNTDDVYQQIPLKIFQDKKIKKRRSCHIIWAICQGHIISNFQYRFANATISRLNCSVFVMWRKDNWYNLLIFFCYLQSWGVSLPKSYVNASRCCVGSSSSGSNAVNREKYWSTMSSVTFSNVGGSHCTF